MKRVIPSTSPCGADSAAGASSEYVGPAGHGHRGAPEPFDHPTGRLHPKDGGVGRAVRVMVGFPESAAKSQSDG